MGDKQTVTVSGEDTDIERQRPAMTEVCENTLGQSQGTQSIRGRRFVCWPFTSTAPSQTAPAVTHSGIMGTQTELEAAERLFGLRQDDISAWPGVLVFLRNLESQFHRLLADEFSIVWKILGNDIPKSPAGGWHWCFAVLDAFATLPAGEDDPSIEKAFQTLLQRSRIPAHEIGQQDKSRGVLAVFALLCWATASLEPILEDRATSAPLHLTAANSGQRYIARDLRRPLSKLFGLFREGAGTVTEGIEWQSETNLSPGSSENRHGHIRFGDDDDVLYESSLNYFTLYTIGRVKLKWVDTLTAHLAFDRSTRTLSLFRYPSFCVANVLRKYDVAVLRSITSKLFLQRYNPSGLPQEPSAVYREVMLSYRLLFGQSSKSRRLIAQLLDRQREQQDAPVSVPKLDPLLPLICTTPLTSIWRGKSKAIFSGNLFPASVLGLDDQLQEVPTYSVQDDFPIFGQRLLRLQRYSLRQQPSAIRDLWRDRRNPLQWYTFWAVFLVGGMSIFLSILQLFVGAAQLYFAVRPLNNSD